MSLDEIGRAVRRHVRGPVLLRRASAGRGVRRRRRRPAHTRPQPQRHRHDDVPDAAARVASLALLGARRSALRARAPRSRRRGTARRCLPRTRTRSRPSRRRSRITCSPSIEQLERDARAPARGVCSDQPQSARRLRDHRHRVSDRSRAHERAARLRRADRQHLRQHRHGRLPARERVGGDAVLLVGLGRVVQDLLLWCTRGVRLPAARRRLRAGQQHHAAEAQPGRARARARDRQQGARPGAGDCHRRPQHAVRRHRRHRGRPAAARVRRCSATRRAPSRWSPPRCRGAEFDAERSRRAPAKVDDDDRAGGSLVRDHDISFSKAHAMAAGFLSGDATAISSKYTEEELARIISARNFVEVRRTPGGPAPSETMRALGVSRELLHRDRAWLDAAQRKIEDAAVMRRQRAQEL